MISGAQLRILSQCLTPLDPKQVGDVSIDVTLGNDIWTQNDRMSMSIIDLSKHPKREDLYDQRIMTSDEGYLLMPGEFLLGSLAEYIVVPYNVCAMFSLRSKIAQAGLEHSTSVWARPGWEGRLILELTNITRSCMRIAPGLLIGQFHFFEVTDAALERSQ